MGKTKQGVCCICGEEKELTYEHIPPRAAFNHFNLKLYDFYGYITQNNAKYKNSQQGAGLYSLCAKCNNDTGTWYGSSYAEFANQGMRYFRQKATGILSVPYTIYPLRVLKQVVSMFASAKGALWCENEPLIRKFLLDPYCTELPPQLDIRMYMVSKGRSKIEPLSVQMNPFTGERFIGSEIAYTPFSFICIDDKNYTNYSVLNELCSIMSFSNYGYDDRQQLFLNIPRKPCNPVTLDFREGIPDLETFIKSKQDRN